jgi:protoporphyrin/coproporphyrin ferrochelatase
MTGVLLINLGTPDGPDPSSVKRYLAEFLMDPWVLDIPAPARWALVHGYILRTRPRKSAEAYAKIWTERGSPLLFHTRDLGEKVQSRLGDGYRVAVGMRYGSPSIADAALTLVQTGVKRIIALPLYPQYSLAATESSIRRTRRVLKGQWSGDLSFVGDFFEHPAFIEAAAEIARPHLQKGRFDFTLFSFHGLPERQIRKLDPTKCYCFTSDACCTRIRETNRQCYRAQCFATARALRARLDLSEDRMAVSFQSRLGRTPWIKPFTDHILDELPKRGFRRLAVLCPSFTADCLETLEEIQIRGREQFLAAGGEHIELIPCVNSSDRWVEGVCQLIQEPKS